METAFTSLSTLIFTFLSCKENSPRCQLLLLLHIKEDAFRGVLIIPPPLECIFFNVTEEGRYWQNKARKLNWPSVYQYIYILFFSSGAFRAAMVIS